MLVYNWRLTPIMKITDKSLEKKELKKKNRKSLSKLETIEKRTIGRIIDTYC